MNAQQLASSSSAADENTAAESYGPSLTAAPATLAQPPSRRSLGRPHYNDNLHNADGSFKLAFEIGAGFSEPVADLASYDTSSYAYSIGVGRRFSKHFATLLQFDWDNFALQQFATDDERVIYNSVYGVNTVSTVGANAHIWSFSLDPTYNVFVRGRLGAYVVAGAGFFHKVTSFNTPTLHVKVINGVPDTLYFNTNFDHYTSNAFGVTGGAGATFRTSKFDNERIYAEVRLAYMDNQLRNGVTLASLNSSATQTYITNGGTNFFPANSHTSIWLPFKFGIRF